MISKSKRSALFLDRDGVINERIEGGYVQSFEEFKFIDGAISAIKALNAIFYPIVVVTNQQGIGKGLMSINDLEQLHLQMSSVLEAEGAIIHEYYFCPHLAKAHCLCRKPETGMLNQATIDFPFIRKNRCWMVGDSPSDIQAAENFGINTVRIADVEDPLASLTFQSLGQFADHVMQFTQHFLCEPSR